MRLYELLSLIPDSEEIVIVKQEWIDWDVTPVARYDGRDHISDFWNEYPVKKIETVSDFEHDRILTIEVDCPDYNTETVLGLVFHAILKDIENIRVFQDIDTDPCFDIPKSEAIDALTRSEFAGLRKETVQAYNTIDGNLNLYI